MASRRMGRYRNEAESAVLCHYACRTPPVGTRGKALDPADTSGRQSTAVCVRSIMPIFKRLWNVIRARHVSDDIQQELETHLALLEEEEQKLGRSPGDARAAARRRFGNAALTNEKTREADLAGGLEAAKKDLLYAARVLRKSPGFSVFAALAIALGIGSTTLIFSIVNSLLLKPLPYAESQRLFMVWQRIPQEDRVSLSTKEFTAWRQQPGGFETLAAFTGSGFTIPGQGAPG